LVTNDPNGSRIAIRDARTYVDEYGVEYDVYGFFTTLDIQNGALVYHPAPSEIMFDELIQLTPTFSHAN
jgi:hypothetical protein